MFPQPNEWNLQPSIWLAFSFKVLSVYKVFYRLEVSNIVLWVIIGWGSLIEGLKAE